jgi:hypothetical protein
MVLLVEPVDHEGASSALERAEFFPIHKGLFDRSEALEEQKWVLPEIPAVLVGLHLNLVPCPALRRKISFGYRGLAACGHGDP